MPQQKKANAHPAPGAKAGQSPVKASGQKNTKNTKKASKKIRRKESQKRSVYQIDYDIDFPSLSGTVGGEAAQ